MLKLFVTFRKSCSLPELRQLVSACAAYPLIFRIFFSIERNYVKNSQQSDATKRRIQIHRARQGKNVRLWHDGL